MEKNLSASFRSSSTSPSPVKGSFRIRQMTENDYEAQTVLDIPSIMCFGDGHSDGDETLQDETIADLSARSALFRARHQQRHPLTKTQKMRRACMWETAITFIESFIIFRRAAERNQASQKLTQLMLPLMLKRSLRKAKNRRRFIGEEELPDKPSTEVLMRRIPMFEQLGSFAVWKITESAMECISYDDGEIIIRGGEVNTSLFYICQGTCLVAPVQNVAASDSEDRGIQPSQVAEVEQPRFLHLGEIFGDVLGVQCPETHYVTARGQVLLWRVNKKQFDACIASLNKPEIERIVFDKYKLRSQECIPEIYPLSAALIEQVPLLRSWRADVVMGAAHKFHSRIYEKNEVIYACGAQPQDVLILLSGSVNAVRPQGGSGQQKTVRTITASSSEMPLLGEAPYVLLNFFEYDYIVASDLICCYSIPAALFLQFFYNGGAASLTMRSQAYIQRAEQLLIPSVETLQRVPVLSSLPHLDKIRDKMTPICYEKNTIVATQNHPIRDIFLIVGGSVHCDAGSDHGSTLLPVNVFVELQPVSAASENQPAVREHKKHHAAAADKIGSFKGGKGGADASKNKEPQNVEVEPIACIGGGWEGLVGGAWCSTWRVTALVEVWRIPITSIRDHFKMLPRSLQHAVLKTARSVQQVALELKEPMTGPLMALPDQAKKSSQGGSSKSSSQELPVQKSRRRELSSITFENSSFSLTSSQLPRSRRPSLVQQDTTTWLRTTLQQQQSISLHRHGVKPPSMPKTARKVMAMHRATASFAIEELLQDDQYKLNEEDLERIRARKRPVAEVIAEKVKQMQHQQRKASADVKNRANATAMRSEEETSPVPSIEELLSNKDTIQNPPPTAPHTLEEIEKYMRGEDVKQQEFVVHEIHDEVLADVPVVSRPHRWPSAASHRVPSASSQLFTTPFNTLNGRESKHEQQQVQKLLHNFLQHQAPVEWISLSAPARRPGTGSFPHRPPQPPQKRNMSASGGRGSSMRSMMLM